MSDTDDQQDKDKKDDDVEKDTVDTKDHEAEAAKWKALARKHEAQAKANAEAARKLQDVEDADKTELQRVTDKAAEAERRATEAEAKALRIEVALDKAPEGMALPQVRKLAGRLAGGTREELEADAVELFEDFTPAKSDTDDDKKDLPRRPRERLKPGAVPDAEPEDTDPAKLASAVPRSW